MRYFILAACGLLTACGDIDEQTRRDEIVTRTQWAQRFIQTGVYLHDSKTDLCFLAGQTRFGHKPIDLHNVPCTDLVRSVAIEARPVGKAANPGQIQ